MSLNGDQFDDILRQILPQKMTFPVSEEGAQWYLKRYNRIHENNIKRASGETPDPNASHFSIEHINKSVVDPSIDIFDKQLAKNAEKLGYKASDNEPWDWIRLKDQGMTGELVDKIQQGTPKVDPNLN